MRSRSGRLFVWVFLLGACGAARPVPASAPLELPSAARLPRPVPRWAADGGGVVALARELVITTGFGGRDRRAEVHALAAGDGSLRWRTSLGPGDGWPTEATLADGTLLLRSDEAWVALDASDGRVRWRAPAPSGTGRSRAIGRSTVVECQDTRLVARSLEDGGVRWEGRCRVVSGAGDALVAIVRECAALPWAPCAGPVTRLREEDGAPLWTSSVQAERVLALDGLVLAADGARVSAIDPRNGESRWSIALAGVEDALSRGDHLVVRTAEAVLALDPRTGAIRWRLPVRPFVFDDGPAWALDERTLVLAIASGDESVVLAVDPDSGTWRAHALLGRLSGVGLSQGEIVAHGLHGRIARWRRGASAPSLASLEGSERLDAILDDPWADAPIAVEQLRGRERRAWAGTADHVLARMPALDERGVEIATLLAARLGDARLVPALVARLAVASPALRSSIVHALVDLADDRGTAGLAGALSDDALSSTAALGLARIGTPEALDALAAHLDARMRAPLAWDPCARLECGDGADRDGDGWPDALERALRTSETEADSDGDGTPDPVDACPSLADGAPRDARSELLQAAYLVVTGIHRSDVVVLAGDEPARCMTGARGPLLHGIDEDRPGPSLALSAPELDASPTEGQRVAVDAWYGCGPLCGFGYRIHLVRRGERWLCDRVEQTGAA